MSDQQISLFGDPNLNPSAPPPDFDRDRIPTDAAVPIPPGIYGDIDSLASHCRQCHRCELGRTRTHAVIGRGNLHADLVIIGEAPGQSEDEQGLPFVGKSGQLLEKILAAVKLDSEQDVYICNVVKCRPPSNRTPLAAEVEACRPYLLEQIRLVNPKIILFTGATALKALTGEKRGISKIRGEWMEWENRLCMAIFHPAYLLRNQSREKGQPKWLMWQDIQKVRQQLDLLRAKESESLA